jgi:1-acyl-sn-glycerol-3-phosphate acyltransferase
MIAAAILFGFYAVASFLAALVAFPLAWATGNGNIIFRTGTWIVSTGIRMAGIRVILTGLENIPKSSCIFMSNHVSNLDPCVIIPPIPQRVSILVKKSLTKVPILGIAMRLADFVPIDRDQRDSAIQSLRAAKRTLNSGLSLAVFAEGSRSRDGKLMPFKKGPFYLAYEAGVPVIPISVSGTETMMRKGSARVFPGNAYVTYHPALQPSDYADREALMDAVRKSIASGLPAWMVREDQNDQPAATTQLQNNSI